MNANIYRLKISLLWLFVFSLPFEYWDPYGIKSYFTITKFIGFLYFGFSIFDIKRNFEIKEVKKTLSVLMLLWLLLTLMSMFNYSSDSPISPYNISFLQNIIMFWLVTNDLIRKRGLHKKIFLSLILGVFLMAVLVNFGIGLENKFDQELGSYRISFFGSNPNGVGNLVAVSLFFLIHMILNRKEYFGKKTSVLLLTIPSFLSLLSFSGSRGALIIGLLGIISLFLFQKGSFPRRALVIIIGIIFMVYASDRIMESQVLQNRIIQTKETGTLGGREEIWQHGWDIFTQNPIFGLGNSGYYHEIIDRMGFYMDPHNLFLYFLITTGIVGLFLYLRFIKILYDNSYLYYIRRRDILLIGILVIYIFSVIKSGGAINSKLYWLLASIIIGVSKEQINVINP